MSIDAPKPSALSRPDSVAAGQLRHLATAVGMLIVFKLRLGPEWIDIIVGLCVAVAGPVYSFANKLAVKEHIDLALMLPADTTRETLDAKVQANKGA